MPEYPIAILTSFKEFNPGYSLTGIVEDQVRMLTSHGHTVHLYVVADFNDASEKTLFEHDPWVRDKVVIKKKIPQANLIDYSSESALTNDHRKVINEMGEIMPELLAETPIVFTHDLIFTGWNLPYGLGVLKACQNPAMANHAWMHWVHSIPSAMRDFWNIRKFGHRHKIVYPNKVDSQRVAEQFKGTVEDIVVIPHIKDYRSFWEYSKSTYDFIEDFPGCMRADIVQVYPASTDRLKAKRVDKIITMFSHIKNIGFKVCLVIANQWATGKQRKEDIESYYKKIRLAGLELNKEVIFTSEWREEFATGIPRRMLRELMLMSNLFIFPTREETFGLVGPEAAMCGLEMVVNRSLPMMMEVQGGCGIYAEFGSFERPLQVPTTEKEYFKALSHLIIGRMRRSEAIASKTFNRQKYNWDNLYEKYYAPAFGESDIW